MERAELALVVSAQIAKVVGCEEDGITEATDLREEYEVDSLELMEIGTRLENVLGNRIDVEDLMGMQNVGDAVDVLYKRMQERQ
ncbi:acyl carrier protein [Streptomyces sp. CB02923]|uniref:acyl carrier protein n=1 Tax=Streptomyces sp. CB02923 TaxID=1718985 RepID=UPI0009A0A4C6|nr:acyl carrier protein [Streptomyces sp. CB02923]